MLVVTLGILSIPGRALFAQRIADSSNDLNRRSVNTGRLVMAPDVGAASDAAASPGAASARTRFASASGGTWSAQIDRRTGNLTLLEGSGQPWIPGRGNGLTRADTQALLDADGVPQLRLLDPRARAVAASVASGFGFDPDALELDPGASGHPAPQLWLLNYRVVAGGLPIEGARILFTIENGNLVSISGENLPGRAAVVPRPKLNRDAALAALDRYVGGLAADDEWVDPGSYHLMPANNVHGRGLQIAGIWQFVFHRPQVRGTFRARIDGVSGRVEEFGDINDYGAITGGVLAAQVDTSDTTRPLPFAEYETGVYSSSGGRFVGPTGATALDGRYVGINDLCGSISQSANGSGAIALGSASPSDTDCTTPGTGGSGNTRSSRTQYYQLNRAKEVARGWLPGNGWLNSQVTANVNLDMTCNAYWDGSELNFFKSGGGCANTGQIPAVALHEYGHGLDQNDGDGPPPDHGSGETYGDFTAALATHASCIGSGFLGSDCYGYGNFCTSCTGVRDIDWAKHVADAPATPDNFTLYDCPYGPSYDSYYGPCGAWLVANGYDATEGHCESVVSSQALWDLANRDLPNPGSGSAWATVDRLWYLSRSAASGAFECAYTGADFISDGCNSGSLFRVFRAVDDDDGNLANGTPHGAAIAAAFGRHAIACSNLTGWNTTHAGVTPPAQPSLSASPINEEVHLFWSGASGNYDLYRNEAGCNAGFIRLASDLTATSYVDRAVSNDVTYYYRVVAHVAGDGAAFSPPSSCETVTAWPSGFIFDSGFESNDFSEWSSHT